MLIDMHVHIWKAAIEKNKMELVREMDDYAVDRIYVSGLGVAMPDKDEISFLNNEVEKFTKEDKRVHGYLYLNPRHDNTMDVLKRGFSEQGMSGVKLWIATKCDDPQNFPIFEYCIKNNIPILIHAFYKTVGQLEFESTGINVAALAKIYPELKIIMAHMGANVYHSIKPIAPFKNVYADISSSMFRSDDVAYTVKALGVERVLFGSDAPGASFNVCVGQVLEAPLTNEERDLIFFKNSLRVFDGI